MRLALRSIAQKITAKLLSEPNYGDPHFELGIANYSYGKLQPNNKGVKFFLHLKDYKWCRK